jgi:precorrin isomerase
LLLLVNTDTLTIGGSVCCKVKEMQVTEVAVPYHIKGHTLMAEGRDIKRGPQVTVGLAPDALNALRQVALQKGIKPATLVRLWVIERLRQELPGWNLAGAVTAGDDE